MFNTTASEIPLPSQPIITRWGTWLDAAMYYAEHFDKVKAVLNELIDEDAASITMAKIQFLKPHIREQLVYIRTWFGKVSSCILQLEDTKMSIVQSLSIVRNLQSDLNKSPGDGDLSARNKPPQGIS